MENSPSETYSLLWSSPGKGGKKRSPLFVHTDTLCSRSYLEKPHKDNSLFFKMFLPTSEIYLPTSLSSA
jgi:hypothetical protein